MPIRIQRFRLRLLRFCYTVEYVPGKQQIIADALSRAPLPAEESDLDLNREVEEYSVSMIKSYPASAQRLEEIRTHQLSDDTLKKVREFCLNGWPEKIPTHCLQYAAVKHELTIVDNLLTKGSHLVIPLAMRGDILKKIHEGHQGIVKCQQRAWMSVWWPGISVQIKDLISRCNICLKYRPDRAEPMMASELPDRPWQKVGSDFFYFRGQTYLLVVDYFSRFIEIAKLTSTTALSVMNYLSSLFARHGVPEEFVSDGSPPYSSNELAKFFQRLGVYHNFSSPKYSQGNGGAERAVQTVKSLLKKALETRSDPYMALLAYRATPLDCGCSPAQLLMGRNLHTPVPVLSSELSPNWPPLSEFRQKDKRNKEVQKKNYDKRHGVRNLPSLRNGQVVEIRGTGRADVIRPVGPRSYLLRKRGDGRIIRRNRRAVILLPAPSDNVPVMDLPVPSKIESPVVQAPQIPRRSERSTKGVLPARYRD